MGSDGRSMAVGGSRVFLGCPMVGHRLLAAALGSCLLLATVGACGGCMGMRKLPVSHAETVSRDGKLVVVVHTTVPVLVIVRRVLWVLALSVLLAACIRRWRLQAAVRSFFFTSSVVLALASLVLQPDTGLTPPLLGEVVNVVLLQHLSSWSHLVSLACAGIGASAAIWYPMEADHADDAPCRCP
jgi:hypothetical protein